MIEQFVIELDEENDTITIQKVLPERKEKKNLDSRLSFYSILFEYEMNLRDPEEETDSK